MSQHYEELLKTGVPASVPKGPINFEHMFDEYVVNTPKVWAHDRSESVGASECFGCIRKNFLSKRGAQFGYERDAGYTDSWGAARRGDLIENYHVVPAVTEGLARRGMRLILAGEDQDTIVDGRSSATLDGLVIDAPRDALAEYGIKDIHTDCFVLEMKSFDPMINLREEKSIHRGQSIMQMGLIRDTTDYKPEFAVVLYVQASWLDDIRPFIVHWDEDVYQIGRARNDRVFTETDPKLLAPEGKVANLCDYCPFTKACADINAGRVPDPRDALKKKEVEAQDTTLLDALGDKVLQLGGVKKKIKDYKVRESVLAEDIKQILIEHKQSRAVGDGWKVNYTLSPGRSQLSKAKMVENGLDPDEFMDSGNPFEILRVTT